MKKESFKTKLTKRQKRNDILVILGVLIFTYIFTLWFSYVIDAFGDWPLSEILLIGLIGSPIVISLLKLPVIFAAIALGIQRGRARRVREDATFVPVQNMEYYRDNLKELNPSLVSLVIDLNIYGGNDIIATLLRTQNKKVIVIEENGGMSVNEENIDQLDAGERELLEMVKNNKLNSKTSLSSWKENRFREAEELGYIRKKNTRNNKDPKIWAIILLVCFFTGFYMWAAFSSTINGYIGAFCHKSSYLSAH